VDDNVALCCRCGATWKVNTHKRKRKDLKCQSCRMHRALVIKYGSEKCIPWQGDFDKATLSIPMFEGKPVLLGNRTCGHSDCTNPNHVAGDH